MRHHFFKREQTVTALCMALVLAGCNDDGDSSNSTTTEPQTSASISAQNATFVTDYADRYRVDLSDTVLVSDGDNFTLVDVTSLSATPPCQVLGQSDHSFTIGADSAKSCDYQYRVKLASHRTSANLTDSAITRVAVTRDASGETSAVELNAINATTLVEQTLEVSDIKALLKSQTGFEVDGGFILSDVVTLPYSDHVATVDPATDAISYTPLPGFEGIERILFSYINDETGEVLLGTLDVAVIQEVNSGFVVDDNITHAAVNINEKIEIDVSPYVYSNDDDDYHLVYVNSFNAVTALLNNDVDNKILTFQTSKPGVHHISFAVSDHYGAYAMGLIELYALDPNQDRPWDDIFLGSQQFRAPPTASETTSTGATYKGSVSDNTYNPPVEVALFTYSQAQAYCGTQGRLPTSAELQLLAGEGVKTNHNWPLSQPYLAEDNGTGVLVDLESGNIGGVGTSVGYLATCVKAGDLQVVTSESSYTDSVANGVDKAKIVAQLTFDGAPVQGQVVEISIPNSASSFTVENRYVETNAYGKAIFYITSSVAQSFFATINYNAMQVGAQVTFKADLENAVLTQETVVNNQSVAWGRNIVVSKLVDIYDNPIVGEEIMVTARDYVKNITINGSFGSAIVTTNNQGEAQSEIVWDGGLSYDRTTFIDSTLMGKGNTGQSASSSVTFLGIRLTAEPLINNADYSGANQIIVKLANTLGEPLSGREVTVKGSLPVTFSERNYVTIDGNPYSNTSTTDSNGEWAPEIRWIGSEPSGDTDVGLWITIHGAFSTARMVTFTKGNTQ